MRLRLPQPGIVGEYDDPLHMRMAYEHVVRFPPGPDREYTAAYLDLARRGASVELPDPNEDLV